MSILSRISRPHQHVQRFFQHPVKTRTSLPITLNRRLIYIFPTGHGFVFIAVMLAMLIGSVNYGNNLGFLLVFLLGGMALVSILHTYRNLLGVRVLSIRSEPVFAGQDAIFSLKIHSGDVARRALSCFLENRRNSVVNLDAQVAEDVELAASANQRGVLRPDALRITSRYPMGLFRAWVVLRPQAACIVYPVPAAGPVPLKKEGVFPGEENFQNKCGVDDFQGLKPYQPGDPVQRISWKSLSRGLGAFSKEFSGQSARHVLLRFGETGEKETERRLSRLCHMVLTADRMGLVYGLELPGCAIPPDRGDAQKHRCLKALALFETASGHGS